MTYDVTFLEVSEQPTAVRRGHVEHTGIAEFLSGAFGVVAGALGEAGLEPAGPPFASYAVAADGGWVVEAGFPVADPITGNGDVEPGSLPGGTVAQTVHEGSYDGLRAAYEAVEAFVAEAGMSMRDAAWETYLDDPMAVEVPRTLVVMACG